MDNRPYGNNAYTIDRDVDYPEINIVIDTMELYEKQKFSLHYDFGDDWIFSITVSKISEAGARQAAAVSSAAAALPA